MTHSLPLSRFVIFALASVFCACSSAQQRSPDAPTPPAAAQPATADYVIGMPVEESRALLARLRDWATQPQYVYRHEWQPGDLLIWDNTGTMHRVLEYPVDSGRLMHRTILAGEEPLN